MTLQTLYENDKERLIASLSGADKPAVIRAIQAELDRILFAFNDQEEQPKVREAANAMVQAVKAAAGLADTVGVTRVYGRTEYGTAGAAGASEEKEKGRIPVRFWILLVVGILLALPYIYVVYKLCTVLEPEGPWYVFFATPLVAMGILFLAGFMLRPKTPGRKEQLHAESLTDPMKVYHTLLNTVLVMDRQLEEIRSGIRLQEHKDSLAAAANADAAEIELMAGLLEDAYGRRSTARALSLTKATPEEQRQLVEESADAAEEMISRLRYYLHTKNIETVDRPAVLQENIPERAWFDLIPAYGTETIRPALVMEGKLLKKGLASSSVSEKDA